MGVVRLLHSLKWKLIVFFTSLLLISGAVLTYTVYNSSEKLLMNSIGTQALKVAEHAAAMVETEQYKTIADEGESAVYYRTLREQMSAVREANGLDYLYIMHRRDTGGSYEYYYVVDGAALDAPDEEVSGFGEVETESYPSLEAVYDSKQPQLGEMTSSEEYGETMTSYVPILDANGEILGVMSADYNASEAYALLHGTRSRIIWISVGILAAALILTLLMARSLINPLIRMKRDMHKVQTGELGVKTEVLGKGEIADLGQSFNRMSEDLSSMILGIKDSSGMIGDSAQVLFNNVGKSRKLGESIYSLSVEVSEGADIQRKAAEDTSRAMDEVGSGVQRVAASSALVAESSAKAASMAEQGSIAVKHTVKQMDKIHNATKRVVEDIDAVAEKSEEMSEIIEAIQDISAQTNLLALNASIEAARAGEHGRGFAVVADQIRKLANQSGNSTLRIAELINETIQGVERAVEAARQEYIEVEAGRSVAQAAGEAFQLIQQEVNVVAGEAQEFTAVAEEIAAAAEEVAASVEEISRLSGRAFSSAEQMTSAVAEQDQAGEATWSSLTELQEKGKQLERLTERFKA